MATAVPATARAGSTTLLIVELNTRGTATRGAGGNNEAIVLYNMTGSPISLTGYRIEARSAQAANYTSRWTGANGQVIAAYSYFLLGGSTYFPGHGTEDDTFGLGISDAGGVRLLAPDHVTVVDAVGFYHNRDNTQTTVTIANGYTIEGHSVSNMPHDDTTVGASNSDVSLQRRFNGIRGYYQDTDDNAADFQNGQPQVGLYSGSPIDPDEDRDGVVDYDDNCVSVANANQADADHDGFGDACDPCPLDGANDADGDGVCGNVDNCPGVANGDQLDSDGDGEGNACDVCPFDAGNDADGDGLCGNVDNCPNVSNPDQLDTDADGAGDVCDGSPYDSVAGICACDGGWANHGEYVSCVASATNDLKARGLISGKQKGAIQSAAARASCPAH